MFHLYIVEKRSCRETGQDPSGAIWLRARSSLLSSTGPHHLELSFSHDIDMILTEFRPSFLSFRLKPFQERFLD